MNTESPTTIVEPPPATASLSVADAAQQYKARGWMPVPLLPRSKRPLNRSWQRASKDQCTSADFAVDGPNIGLLLGERSGWLVDVDLDCEEAIELAPDFLPQTGLITGRRSKPRSHWWYIADGARSLRLRDHVNSSSVVELRSTGGQTMVYPSVHPSGEPCEPMNGEPAVVTAEAITKAVQRLHQAVLAKRGRTPGQQATHTERSNTTPSRNGDKGTADRARAYLDKMPAAISGQGGHARTYAAATALVHGFCLHPDDALMLLRDGFNPRCQPPWSEAELRHKVEDAANKPHEQSYGWLLNKPVEALASSSPGDRVLRREASPPSSAGAIPDSLLAVPGFVGEVMAYNLSTAKRPQPSLALAGALALQSVLAGRRVRDALGNRTNSYLVCVADSGAGKDHARQVNKRILEAAGLDKLDGPEDVASEAGLINAVYACPSLLIQFDEFGRFLRTIGDSRRSPHLFGVLSALMRLYSAAGSTFRGKAYANTDQNKAIVQPCLTLLATTAPEHFHAALTPEAMSDGLLARFLLFESSARPSLVRNPERPAPESIADAARWWGEQGRDRWDRPEPRLIETTPEAEVLLREFSERCDGFGEENEFGGAVWARAEEKAHRLALIYACSERREGPLIDAPAARWACALCEFLTANMLRSARDHLAQSPFEARVKAIVRVLRLLGGSATRAELTRRTQSMTPKERAEALQQLNDEGRLHEESQKTKGRSVTKFTLLAS